MGSLDGSLQAGDGFLILLSQYSIGSLGAFLFHHTLLGDAVPLHLSQDVLGIIGPLQSHVASCQPGLCHAYDVWLGAVESQDVVVGAGGFDELPSAEL